MTNYNKKAICQTANTLRKRGYTLSEAFRKAWELAKNITSKVSGVSFGKRPAAFARLTKYNPEQINVQLVRESTNQHDRTAIAVMVGVEGKGKYQVGYVPAEISKILATVIDTGTQVKATLDSIVGGWFTGQNYGMRISLGI